jgi:transglutaminase-like putative cysteine protease
MTHSTTPTLLRIRHVTTYRYREPVGFGEHRMLFRPHEGHEIKIRDASMTVSVASDQRWIQDVFGNSVAIVMPRLRSDQLRFESVVDIEHHGASTLELPLEERALMMPVAYNGEERQVLAPYIGLVDEDPAGQVALWAKAFVADTDNTQRAIDAMMIAFRDGFEYQAREAEGTQKAVDTLRQRSGTCRDYAWLMIEGLRSLGIACRFVTGYIYDAALDPGANPDEQSGRLGAGATHAWLEAYLPGAGWVSYDPTNRLTGGRDLVRVGHSRRPQEAVPLAGSWYGVPEVYIGMTVDVTVSRIGESGDANR